MFRDKNHPPNSWILERVCMFIIMMRSQMTEVTASPQDAIFKWLPVSNVIYTADVLWEQTVRSRTECSAMCGKDASCLMFTFRSVPSGPQGSCRAHRKRMSPKDNAVSAPGARSFNLVAKEPWLRKYCTSSSQCTEPITACYSNKCLCDQGYFYDSTLNACMSSCARGLGTTYLKYQGMNIQGRQFDSKYLGNNPIDGCYQVCNAEPICVTFIVYLPNKYCFFKNATAQDYPAEWQPNSNVIFYQRACN